LNLDYKYNDFNSTGDKYFVILIKKYQKGEKKGPVFCRTFYTSVSNN